MRAYGLERALVFQKSIRCTIFDAAMQFVERDIKIIANLQTAMSDDGRAKSGPIHFLSEGAVFVESASRRL